MIVLGSTTSPFVRKVRMMAIEKGLIDAITWKDIDLSQPAHAQVEPLSPLGKVPALVLDDGSVIVDSPVICDYLDALIPAPVLIPPTGHERWLTLTVQAVADGVCDAAVAVRLETQRPTAMQSQSWIERNLHAIDTGLDALAQMMGGLRDAPSVGTLAAVAALGYLDFRLPTKDWRTERGALATWYRAASQHHSALATIPQEARRD